MGYEVAVLRIAYTAYVVWLLAGLADFVCHRRSNLPLTSGLRESRFHLGQVGLIGSGAVLWLALEPGWHVFWLCALLTCVHAVIGYLDTKSAYGLRPITPIEQHLHSVLDTAPWIGLALMAWLIASDDWMPAVGLRLRSEPLAARTWFAILAPAVLLVGVPVLAELGACSRAAKVSMKAP